MAKRDVRFFNTTGPCFPDDHYMLPPEERLVGAQLSRYIKDKLYWALHAPRQTGKTTFLLDWMRRINAGAVDTGGEPAAACYVSVERCQGVTETKDSMPALCDAIRSCAETYGLPVPSKPDVEPGSMLNVILREFARLTAPRPLARSSSTAAASPRRPPAIW